MTRALVLAMGGEIEATSTPGAGSTFSVQLPLAGGAQAEVPATQAPAQDQGAPSP